jgi:(p)ppGpp synthase/HD superfamily hydrolase
MRKYTPERYIVHPVRVMNMCRQYTDDITILAAALLHDVLEDTPVIKDEIGSFLSQLMSQKDVHRTLYLVEELTDVYVKDRYPKWNRRTRKTKELERLERTSADSQTIKYADIVDNCKEIVANDPDFAGLFLRECSTMLKRLNKGNQQLYKQALETIGKEMQMLKKQKRS